MKKMWKKTLSLLMTLSMVITMMPAVAWAEDHPCAHIHNAECGYVQEVEGVACGNNGVIACTHENCGFVEASDAVACDAADPTTCTHESCSFKEAVTGVPCGNPEGFPCTHESCGYVEAVAGSPCTYEHGESCVPTGNLDMANGSVVIDADGYTITGNNKVDFTGDYTITQSVDETANTITVNGIADGKTITLNGVNIKAPSGYPAILIAGDATIRMAANSENTLTGGQNHPAIEPLNGKTVTVGGAGDGALNVTGGGNETAAIGGADGYSFRGCNLNNNSRNFGSVIINGGTITATAAHANGSAIGSTRLGHIASVTINGGTIYANNNRAVYASGTGSAGSVVINGGKIVARNVDNAISTGNNGTITIDSDAVITGGAASYKKGSTQYDRTQIKIWGTGAEQKNAIVTVEVDGDTSFQTETDENGWISYLYLTDNEQHTINITGAGNEEYTTGAFTATAGNVVFAKNTAITDYSDKCTMENSSIAFDASVPSSVPMYDGVATFVVECPATQTISESCYAAEHILSYSYVVEKDNVAVADSERAQYAELNGTTLTLKRNGSYNVIITAACGSVTASKTIEVVVSSEKALNIANGEITVVEGTTPGTVKYQQGGTDVFDNVASTENVLIIGETTTNRIIVQKDATITLKDVSITISSNLRRPMQVLDGATLNLWLEGDNNLTAKFEHGAGIFVEYGSTLVIDSADGTLKNADISSEHGGDKQKGYAGSLHVTGATSGCGIGWDYWTEFTDSVDDRGSGSVTIKGGNVTALGGDNSAPYRSNSGIGAGWYNLDATNPPITNYPNGDITINGGNVYAGYVGRGGRGISSGSGNLTITGGVVYAYGGGEGHAGTVGAIHSFGGTITIGSENGTDEDLSLYAATTDTVDSGGKAAAIGGANGVVINIVSGTITAESSGSSAAIGGNNSIEGNVGSITISGGNVTTTSKSGENNGTAVGIGVVGDNATCPTIKITGGIVNCENTLIGTNNAENENPIAVTVGKDAKVKIDNSSKENVTFTFEGGATINETTLPEDVEEIIIPGGSVDQVQGNADGTFTIPAGSVVKDNGTEITLGGGGALGTDGAVTMYDGTATIKKGEEITTVVIPEGSEGTVNGSAVTLPAGSTVTLPNGTSTTVSNGGSVNLENGTVTHNYSGSSNRPNRRPSSTKTEEKVETGKEDDAMSGNVETKEIVLTIGSNTVLVDGESVTNDVAPIIQGDRTFLPIRVIAEALGATVTWSQADQSVTIVKGDTTIVLYIGQAFALVNGNPVQLDVPAFISNDRTYLPIRFISENLGANVAWDGLTRTVTIIG